MEKETILVIEPDEAERARLAATLEREGYRIWTAENGEEGLQTFLRGQPDLVLLETVLPGIDGLEVCRQIRAKSIQPIIIVSVRQDEVDKVVGLEVGADDYIAKPYGERELVARVRAVLRRCALTSRLEAQKRRLSYPFLDIELTTRRVFCQGEPVHLTPKEFELLYYLASHPTRVFSRAELVRQIWGFNPSESDLRTVDTHIKRLRKKLQYGRNVPWALTTVWGVGYRFDLNE